ncbi:MAG: hypothetical protein II655_02745, partial [Thermoguttaceae bacterium]|nr:hypothetical protein [Thermoguttaceae bacterium]
GLFFHPIFPVGKQDVGLVSDCRKHGGLLKLLGGGLFANNPDDLRADVSGVFWRRLTETVFPPRIASLFVNNASACSSMFVFSKYFHYLSLL